MTFTHNKRHYFLSKPVVMAQVWYTVLCTVNKIFVDLKVFSAVMPSDIIDTHSIHSTNDYDIDL